MDKRQSLFNTPSFFAFCKQLFRLKQENFAKTAAFKQIQAKQIQVLKHKHPMHVDAEYIGDTDQCIEIKEKALLVYA